MKRCFFSLVVFFFVSCSSDDSVNQEPTVEKNSLDITYRGFYQEFFGEPYLTDSFSNISVTKIEEQISPTETIPILKINAYSSGNTEDYITFKVFKNNTGNNVLYNNDFSFRSFGATYFPSNFSFETHVNNEQQFSATFSGELEHWYEGELRFVYLDITSASITVYY